MYCNKTLLAQIVTRSYPVTPVGLLRLAERIREIEGFYVNLDYKSQPLDDSDYSPGIYDYQRAASGKMNICKWRQIRFNPRYPNLEVMVASTEGKPMLDDELISHAKSNRELPGHSLEYPIIFTIKSKKESKEEKAVHLQELHDIFSSFSIFTSLILTDKPRRFIFKWHINKLELITKPLILLPYERYAVIEIFRRLISQMDCEVEYERDYLDCDMDLNDDDDDYIPPSIAEKAFASHDLNSLIPSKQASVTKELLGLNG